MKKVRLALFGVLTVGILLVPGLWSPPAIGQQSLTDPVKAPAPSTSQVQGEPGVKVPTSGYGQTRYIIGTRYGMSPTTELAKQYVDTTKEDEKKEIKKKLSDALNKEFDQSAQAQQTELDELEKQVAALKTLLRKRKDAKEAIVERRLEQLIQDAGGLGWGSSTHSGHPYANTLQAK